MRSRKSVFLPLGYDLFQVRTLRAARLQLGFHLRGECRSISDRVMMSPLTLATISSTRPISAAGSETDRHAVRARLAQTLRNFICGYCSNYTGRRRSRRRSFCPSAAESPLL